MCAKMCKQNFFFLLLLQNWEIERRERKKHIQKKNRKCVVPTNPVKIKNNASKTFRVYIGLECVNVKVNYAIKFLKMPKTCSHCHSGDTYQSLATHIKCVYKNDVKHC